MHLDLDPRCQRVARLSIDMRAGPIKTRNDHAMIGWIGIFVMKIELDRMDFQALTVAIIDEVDPFVHLLRNEHVFRIAIGVGEAMMVAWVGIQFAVQIGKSGLNQQP